MSVERSSPRGAVFLSYAREDSPAAQRIAEALRAFGVEVWFDQSELRGGDSWDQKIRGQIKACALFVPIISGESQARREGYFRLEWKLAAQRTHTIADGTPFLLPVVTDATRDADALVPEEFRAVQWTRLPAGETTAAFVGRVKNLLAGPTASPAAKNSDPAAPQISATTASAAKSGFPSGLVATLAVVVLGIIAFIALRPAAKEAPVALVPAKPVAEAKVAPSATRPATDQSVAVLAFANMSADKDTEYFSDGISEEILDALANNPALRVAARTSSFSFKGKNATAGEIGRALNVARVIEGSVRKAGNKVRITVQLINAADGYHLWSETFDRDLTDIFAVQSEIAAKVAQKLSGGAGASPAPVAPLAAAPTKNLAAYDAYLRGRALQIGGQTASNWLEAQRLYEEAVRLDPSYAVAWARLAQVFARIGGGYDRSVGIAAKARNAAATALRLNPDLPEGHLAMALVRFSVDHDFDATQRELDETERLHPNDPEVPATRARLEQARGHWSEGLVALTARAVALDPLNGSVFEDMGRILAQMGRYAEAERLYVRCAELAPDSHMQFRRAENHLTWTGEVRRALDILATIPESLSDDRLTNLSRGQMLTMNEEIAPAISAYEKVMANVASLRAPSSGPRGVGIFATYRSGQLEARRGNRARAAELYAGALAAALQITKDYDLYHEDLAVIRALRGERSEALAAMDEAMQKAARSHDAGAIASVRGAKAEMLAVLGETDAAIAELRALHEMGWAFGYRLRLGLEWEPLRGDAKFQQLMKEAEARADAQPRPKK